MHRYSVNYLAQREPEQRGGTLVDRAFWLDDVPRLIPRCRLFGHRPVVDGTAETRPGQPGTRWVCCDRCGVRPEPQGNLDPCDWNIGDSYTGPWRPALPHLEPQRRDELRSLKGRTSAPGPWPQTPTGEVGGQLIIGRTFGGAGIEFKVGSAGSEHTLAASLRLHHLGALHIHTHGFGQWLQRRLNANGYSSRVIEVTVDNAALTWRLWAKRDELDSDTPAWREGWVSLDPRDWLWGKHTLDIESVGEPCAAVISLPGSEEEHLVTLQLKRWTTRRQRRRRRKSVTWAVDWRCAAGIETSATPDPDHPNTIHGAQEFVSAEAVRAGSWGYEAVAALVTRIASQRAQTDPVHPPTLLRGQFTVSSTSVATPSEA